MQGTNRKAAISPKLEVIHGAYIRFTFDLTISPESAMSMAGRTSAPYPESPSQSPQGDAPVDTMAQPRAKAVQALGADRWIMKTVETVIETHTETHSDSTRPEPRVSVGRAAADLQSPATPIPLDSNL